MLPDERITDLYARLDTANSLIKELEQRLVDSDVYKDLQAGCIKNLGDNNRELERTIANNALLEPLQVRRLKRDANAKACDHWMREAAHWADELTEANALLRECLEQHIVPSCDKCNLRDKVAAHLNPPSDLGDNDGK